MAQYQNGGSNPVTVQSAPDIATFTGICGLTQASTVNPPVAGTDGANANAQAGAFGASEAARNGMTPSGSGLALLVALVFTLVTLL